jgi:hypothetical protein
MAMRTDVLEADVSTLLLEDPRRTAVPAEAAPADPWRQTLISIMERLESWLPAEEQRLSFAREVNFPASEREAEWRDMLQVYERLSRVLGRPAQA